MTTKNDAKRARIAKRLTVLIFCLSPLLSFAFVKHEWLARLMAVTGVFGIINGILLAYCLNPKSNFIPAKSKLAKASEKTKRTAQAVIRGITILFAIFMLWFVTMPNIFDCIGVMRKGRSYLMEISGQVRNNDLIFGTFFLIQPITVVKLREATYDSYSALFFHGQHE